MYDIYLVTKVFFVFTKNKRVSNNHFLSAFFVLSRTSAVYCRDVHQEESHPAFFPADVSIALLSSVRRVSGCLEKYVLVEGLAKLAGPNMDIVDVLFFPPGSQTRR